MMDDLLSKRKTRGRIINRREHQSCPDVNARNIPGQRVNLIRAVKSICQGLQFFSVTDCTHTAQRAKSLLVHVLRAACVISCGSVNTLAVLLIIQGLRSESSFRKAVAAECSRQPTELQRLYTVFSTSQTLSRFSHRQYCMPCDAARRHNRSASASSRAAAQLRSNNCAILCCSDALPCAVETRCCSPQ
jgi:hypothetical protein